MVGRRGGGAAAAAARTACESSAIAACSSLVMEAEPDPLDMLTEDDLLCGAGEGSSVAGDSLGLGGGSESDSEGEVCSSASEASGGDDGDGNGSSDEDGEISDCEDVMLVARRWVAASRAAETGHGKSRRAQQNHRASGFDRRQFSSVHSLQFEAVSSDDEDSSSEFLSSERS